MIRVSHDVGIMNRGGIKTFKMNIYRKTLKHFICHTLQYNCANSSYLKSVRYLLSHELRSEE